MQARRDFFGFLCIFVFGFLWFSWLFMVPYCCCFLGGLRETAKDVTLVALQKQGTNGRLKERFRAGWLHREGGRAPTPKRVKEKAAVEKRIEQKTSIFQS